MNNKEQINVIQDKMDALQRELDVLKTGGGIQFLPKMREEYWCVLSDETGQFRWDNDSCDKWYLLIGNCFRTEEEAEFHKKKLETIAKMNEMAEWWLPDWNDMDQSKWSVCL